MAARNSNNPDLNAFKDQPFITPEYKPELGLLHTRLSDYLDIAENVIFFILSQHLTSPLLLLRHLQEQIVVVRTQLYTTRVTRELGEAQPDQRPWADDTISNDTISNNGNDGDNSDDSGNSEAAEWIELDRDAQEFRGHEKQADDDWANQLSDSIQGYQLENLSVDENRVDDSDQQELNNAAQN